MLISCGLCLKSQDSVYADSLFLLKLTDASITEITTDKTELNLSDLESPCYSIIALESQNSRFTLKSTALDIQGSNTEGSQSIAKFKFEDAYGISQSMTLDFLDFMPNFLIEPNQESRKKLFKSKFSITYESLNNSKAKQFFGKDFQVIQLSGNASLKINSLGRKSITLPHEDLNTNHYEVRLTLEVENGFLIKNDNGLKYLSETEVKQWFPAKTIDFWLFFKPSDIFPSWFAFKDKDILRSNYVSVDQKVRSKQLCGAEGERHMYLYPNPSYGEINLKFENFEQGDYVFEVYNIIGKPLYSKSIEVEDNSMTIELSLPNLTKGSYLYSILNKQGRRLHSRRLTIVGY